MDTVMPATKRPAAKTAAKKPGLFKKVDVNAQVSALQGQVKRVPGTTVRGNTPAKTGRYVMTPTEQKLGRVLTRVVAEPGVEKPLPLKFSRGDTDRTVSRSMLSQLAKDMGVTETAVVHEALAKMRDERYPLFGGYDLPTEAELEAYRKVMPQEPANAKSLFD